MSNFYFCEKIFKSPLLLRGFNVSVNNKRRFFPQLKDYILDSLKKEDSDFTIRLIFSSVALGMGADFKYVSRVIHAGPPTTLESRFASFYFSITSFIF